MIWDFETQERPITQRISEQRCSIRDTRVAKVTQLLRTPNGFKAGDAAKESRTAGSWRGHKKNIETDQQVLQFIPENGTEAIGISDVDV